MKLTVWDYAFDIALVVVVEMALYALWELFR